MKQTPQQILQAEQDKEQKYLAYCLEREYSNLLAPAEIIATRKRIETFTRAIALLDEHLNP